MEHFAWPGAIVVIAVVAMILFRGWIGPTITQVVKVDWKNGVVVFKTPEVEKLLSEMLNEAADQIRLLRPEERDQIGKILEGNLKAVPVQQVFPHFARGDENREHKLLRGLRDAHLIRPSEGGRWESNKLISAKPFGSMVWSRIRSA